MSRNEDDKPLPDLAVGEALDLVDVEANQHFTKRAPLRYGEASLVRELEKRGIGRPSTYAAIISTIQERGYVTLAKRRFHAEKIGELVNDRLVEQFRDLLDYGFTAKLELELDQVAARQGPLAHRAGRFLRGLQPKPGQRPAQRRRHAAQSAHGYGHRLPEVRPAHADQNRPAPACFSAAPAIGCRPRSAAKEHST